jgi:hypothetical protein
MLKDVKTLTLDAVKEYTSDTLKFDKAMELAVKTSIGF